MKLNKQYPESKAPRTHSWKALPKYDKHLADLDISSLRALKVIRKQERKDFWDYFDKDNAQHRKEYDLIIKTEGMINEELRNRRLLDSPDYEEEYFDIESGIVFGEDGRELYAVSYSEEEDELVYTNLNTNVSGECRTDDETDYELYEPTERTARYAKWDYTKMIKDE